jgi:uncharacterized membrane protein YedE/YeeE
VIILEELLANRPAWYVAGPLIGLVVIGLLASINQRLGVLGGYSDIVDRLSRRSLAFGWRTFFLLGIVAGSVLFSLLAGVWRAGAEYGWLSRALEGDGAVAALLLGAGVLIGVGAKTAGGCTSGNGLSGCSFGSPASFVATATFMTAAIVTAFVARLVLGGGT